MMSRAHSLRQLINRTDTRMQPNPAARYLRSRRAYLTEESIPDYYGLGDDPPGFPHFTYVASIHRYGQSPSIGRSRNARTRSSISVHSRETWLLLIPPMPIALTSSSTERVETPWMYASWITAARAFSAVRRGSRKPGE